MADKNTKITKGDPNRAKRLAQQLRANLAKRKAQARAVASDNEAQARGRAAEEDKKD